MTCRFIDSFDHYTQPTEMTPGKWTARQGTIAISTTYGRNGTQGFGWTAGTPKTASKTIAGARQKSWTVGFAYRTNALPGGEARIASMQFGDHENIQLKLGADGILNVLSGGTNIGSGTTALGAGSWYYIEWQTYAHTSSGSFAVKLDGNAEASATNVNTDAAWGDDGNNQLRLWGETQVSFDDVYILDNASPNNTFWGDTKVVAVYPTADATYEQWTPTSGVDHYALVDESTPNVTDYIYTSVNGNNDSFTVQSITGAPFAVQQVMFNRAFTTSGSMYGLIRISSTDYTSGSLPVLSSGSQYAQAQWDVNPNTLSPWTQAAFNGAEFGLQSVL